jgi:hypothetical protein
MKWDVKMMFAFCLFLVLSAALAVGLDLLARALP